MRAGHGTDAGLRWERGPGASPETASKSLWFQFATGTRKRGELLWLASVGIFSTGCEAALVAWWDAIIASGSLLKREGLLTLLKRVKLLKHLLIPSRSFWIRRSAMLLWLKQLPGSILPPYSCSVEEGSLDLLGSWELLGRTVACGIGVAVV